MAARGQIRPRGSIQLARVFGIRVGVSASWFFVLLFLIFFLSQYFHEVLKGSTSTAYAVAVVGAFGYFASLVLHELGHALVSRRLGIPILGIDLWFFGGMARPAREPETAGEEFKVAAAGPLVTLAIVVICAVAIALIASSGPYLQTTGSPQGHAVKALLGEEGVTTTPAVALLGWLLFINALLLVFNLVPAFPLDGGRIARAAIWWRTGDRNRGTRMTGRAGQGFAMALGLIGLLVLLEGDSFGIFTLLLGVILYQAAGGAVIQGAIGQRIQSVTVADIMEREPVAIPTELKLLDAQEQFFLRYRQPWFAVIDHTRHFLGVVREQRIDEEIAAGRPALEVGEVLEQDLPVRIDEQEPLESLLRSEALGRLGGMVAVDADGVLRGIVTVAQIRAALNPAGGR
jgi:Zn-dependent protease